MLPLVTLGGLSFRHPQLQNRLVSMAGSLVGRMFVQALFMLCSIHVLRSIARCYSSNRPDPTLPYRGSAPPSSPDCLLYTAFVASRLLRLVLPGSLFSLLGMLMTLCRLEICIYICICSRVPVCLCVRLSVGRCHCLSNCAPFAERLVGSRLASLLI